ncbi:hypothetical protein [Alkalimarinus sediminis]|uniref:Uncharacterized protein n=1 Tax=Alkalimarinus sediminis TaxID=1632866 RepID=A0A9E8HPP4_9ALTE|nr:hypothetical protein [Alkalimarinus sediminis]UZW73544.1 hypothetical protein NNL22_10880 [Alkalimarinus sediminis]
MIVKIFALLLAVNLFTVVANAEAADYGNAGYTDSLNQFANENALTGDDEILIEKGLSKSDCLLRLASMFGSQWFNDTIELQRLDSAKGEASVSRYPYSLRESLAEADYGLDVGSDEFTVSMKIQF